MIDNSRHLSNVIDLCSEVMDLATEMNEQVVTHYRSSYAERPPHPKGTALSGELRRRSLDLTRALAELRKS